MSTIILHVLGTAQDAGLPHPNCFCINCKKAIKNPKYQRAAASLAIRLPQKREWYLIDATPDLRQQMINFQLKYNMEEKLMTNIFLTHAHLGHYPGLLLLGKEAMNTNKIPVRVGRKMRELLENHAPWQHLFQNENIEIKEITNEKSVQVAKKLKVTPIEVPHRNEFSETFGFWIEGNKKKVLYIPDIDSWQEWGKDIYQEAKKADICLLDGTFYSKEELETIARDPSEIPHPLMTETIDRLEELTKQTAIYFTHLNHSNPVLNENRKTREEIEERGFYIAEEGMEFII